MAPLSLATALATKEGDSPFGTVKKETFYQCLVIRIEGWLVWVTNVELLDGAMHVQAVLYRTTRIKILCIKGNQWNQGE